MYLLAKVFRRAGVHALNLRNQGHRVAREKGHREWAVD